MNPVLDVSELSKAVVQDLLRAGLQAYADDENEPLTDPLDPRDAKQAPFVLSSYPDIGAAYPHIVVRENNVELSSLDNKHDVFTGEFSAGIEVIATNDTEKFVLKDAVRAFVVREYADGVFTDAGFSDVSIDSTTDVSWDESHETRELEITITGTVYVT